MQINILSSAKFCRFDQNQMLLTSMGNFTRALSWFLCFGSGRSKDVLITSCLDIDQLLNKNGLVVCATQ